MKTVAALALLASTAAAFAPAQESRASTSLSAYDDALGAQEPLGFWYVCSHDECFGPYIYFKLSHLVLLFLDDIGIL